MDNDDDTYYFLLFGTAAAASCYCRFGHFTGVAEWTQLLQLIIICISKNKERENGEKRVKEAQRHIK